jgi:hypothetical protein
LNARPFEQESAGCRADHAACIAGADVQRHRGAHPLAAHDFTYHHTAHRVVGAPAAPVDEAGERELPNLELSGPAQKCEDRRSATHQKHDDEERSSAIKRSASAPRKNPNRPIGSRRSMVIIETRNAGALVDDNSDRNGFHPAHGSDDQADIPQEPEVRRTGLDHPPERRAASFGDGIGDLTVAQVPIPRLLSQGRG